MRGMIIANSRGPVLTWHRWMIMIPLVATLPIHADSSAFLTYPRAELTDYFIREAYS